MPTIKAIAQRYGANWERYKQEGGIADIDADASIWNSDDDIVRDIGRFTFFCLAFDQIHKERVVGDIAELGVYKGTTAAILARYAHRLTRTLYLLDTFEGFDQRDIGGAGMGGLFTDTSLAGVRAKVGERNVQYIKGYFPETACELPAAASYALVHIDADLYAPIYSALAYFYPRVTPGGFIIVHDYGSLCWPGAERAVDDFFADKTECLVPIPDSAGSAVVRKERKNSAGSTWMAARQTLDLDRLHRFGAGQENLILQQGWSIPEKWGVWGIGPQHELRFRIESYEGLDLYLECDVHAYLPPNGAGRSVKVVADSKFVSEWRFTEGENRAPRKVSVERGIQWHKVELFPIRCPLLRG